MREIMMKFFSSLKLKILYIYPTAYNWNKIVRDSTALKDVLCIVIADYRFAIILFRDDIKCYGNNDALSLFRSRARARELSVRYGQVSRWYLLITLTVLPRSRTLVATALRRMYYHSLCR